MFAVERDIDSELVRAWQMLQELVEQQEHNQKLIATLKSRASSLKVRMLRIHICVTGGRLRTRSKRFTIGRAMP